MNRATIIKVGQEIALPEPTPEAEVVPAKPAAPQIESAVETDELTVYIVKKGDSLGRIARKHKTTVKHLMDINGLKNHNIKIGQKLNVSKKGAAAAKQSETKKAVVLAGGELEYVVKSGDTLGGIAHRHGTSVKAIMERNSIKDARKLRVGQKLVIVSKKAVAKAEKKQEAKPEQPKAETKSEPQITVVGDANAKTESAASQAPVVAPAAAPAAPATPAPAVAPEAAPASQQTELPTLTPPHEACPSKADWERMMKYMDALWHHADRQTDLLESVSRQMSQLPTRTQLDDLLKAVRHLEQMTEQAGKPKENSFSLHRIRLPRLHLPHVSIPALISLLMAAAALLLLWWGLGTVWSSSSLLIL